MVKSSKSKWSEREEKKLLDFISESSGNIFEACRRFNRKYPHRSAIAAYEKWHHSLKKRNNARVCLITLDKKHRHVNSKIVKLPNPSNEIGFSIWRSIRKLLHI